jgi:hypothetical protein
MKSRIGTKRVEGKHFSIFRKTLRANHVGSIVTSDLVSAENFNFRTVIRHEETDVPPTQISLYLVFAFKNHNVTLNRSCRTRSKRAEAP